MKEIVCKIVSIVHANKQTGFFVLKATVNGSTETVRGCFPGTEFGTGLKVKFGGDHEDSKYGKQFHATSCEIIPEAGKSGVTSYLIAHVKSIGPITAARLFDAFGDDLINILNKEPDKIQSLPFLTKTQSEAIVTEWKKASDSRTASIFLTDLGLSASQVRNAFDKFGKDIRAMVESNPYSLCLCPGVGFPTADQVARRLGIGIDDPKRIKAVILFLIDDLSRSEGHVYVTSAQILNHAKKTFKRNGIDQFSHGGYFIETSFFSYLMELRDSGEIIINGMDIYLPSNWTYENESAKQISAMLSSGGVDFDVDSLISEFEADRKFTLSEDQREALALLNKSKICVVSGYPGTGKTTLISAFVHIFKHLNLEYVLMSPTGIASKRLSQVTNETAYTIHRALGCNKKGEWEFNASCKYATDAIICDEMSMVDMSTFYHLITSLNPNTIVVMVGDVAQLPSVGAGYVLHEFMNCLNVPHKSLTRIYRQDGCSDIIKTAHSILRGEQVDLSFRKNSEFVFLSYPQDEVLSEIGKLTEMMKNRKLSFQVIAPMYDGDLGVNNLNRTLRGALNDSFATGNATKIKHGEIDMYEGDRVMVTKNDYDRDIFNGDVGKIQRVSIKQDEVEVKIFNWFDAEAAVPRYVDKMFIFKIEEARSILKVAYACTTHRVQGQEYDYIIMPMTMRYGVMLYRNLVYTAITRAKKKVFVFGDKTAFSFAINNNRETIRNSNLSGLIRRSDEDRQDA